MSRQLDEDSCRLFTPCPSLTSQFSETELITTYWCGRFFARCCHHKKEICHHYRVVYTDGACSNNGRPDAAAGVGIAFGMHKEDREGGDIHQFSIPVDEKLDPGGKRTNQRAELLAALVGLKKICGYDEKWLADCSERLDRGSAPVIIITTDSEYVVKGMAEWLPNWKKNGFRRSDGRRPSNLDLFLMLDAEVDKRERKHDCRVKFWHIDRNRNSLADQLAKSGARAAARSADDDLESIEYAVSAWELTD